MVPQIREFKSSKSPWEIFQALYRRSDSCFFLDSIRYAPPDQHYSYVAADPFIEVTIPDPAGKKPRVIVTGAEKISAPAGRVFDVLRRLLRKHRFTGPVSHPFFCGGAVGYWGYELISLFERVKFRPKESAGLPWLYLGFFRDVIVYDHRRKVYALVTHGRRAGEAFQKMEEAFQDEGAEAGEAFEIRNFRPGVSRSAFESRVRRAKNYIAAGDVYQANLSQRFTFDCVGSKLKLYERLRAINPSPFASFFKVRGVEIISSSPERLVAKRGRMCETRPIAGTRPRVAGRPLSAIKKELLASEKERAEHIMLVDLERNDLGRVCDWKTVRVEEMMKIEKYSHVLHIVSKITGRLAKGKDGLDLIRAMFPGGTITGCPKVRCMEIIDELEPVRRGLYTGSLGYLDFRGDLDLNIVIRTLVFQARALSTIPIRAANMKKRFTRARR